MSAFLGSGFQLSFAAEKTPETTLPSLTPRPLPLQLTKQAESSDEIKVAIRS